MAGETHHGDTVVPIEKPVVTPPVVDTNEKPIVTPPVETPVVPKVDEPPVVKDEPVVVEYQEWEDPSANAAVELLKEAGVSAAQAGDIFNKAIESGNLTDIDVKALEAKVGKTKALLIMNGVTDFHRRSTEVNTATVSTVQKVFGGEQGWNTVKEWAQAREKVDPSFGKELNSIRDDFNRGGRAATAAAKDLLALYNGAPNTKGLGNSALVSGDSKAAPAGAPLTRADYNTELKKAHEAGNMALVKQLDARRMAGMKAGI